MRTRPTLVDTAHALASGVTTSQEIVESVLAAAEATEPDVHAYVALDAAAARAAARTADATPAAERGPLHGLPVGVKDLIATAGLKTRAGSHSWTHPTDEDAAVVRRLRAAGGIVTGKQHTHEFGYGLDEPPTRHPHDPGRYAGGSTIGGAVSVAVGSSLAAIGTDGGGSIRKPAALHGLVGLKPTHGLVDTAGVVPGVTTNDHVGWITTTVADSALLLAALTGLDPVRTDEGVAGLRIGCVGYFFRDLEPAVDAAVRRGLDRLAAAGAEIVWFEIPELDLVPEAHGTIGASGAAAHHRDVPAHVRAEYAPGVREFLDRAERITEDETARARRVREDVRHAVDAALDRERIDALCSPTLALGALPLATMKPEHDLPRYCRLTAPFNLTGHPAVSVPVERGDEPVGLQVAARYGADAMTLRVAAAVEARHCRPGDGRSGPRT
ncbi:amidase [Streptomyces cavernicola]|uniref:Amidase n=1 Tax=Streptomyces cavernicola TaxID=3043613 RepID=A0ABT6SBP4_9ACTN|nr:amidase [Streptomyces sp. B-S-A6]MDI3405616.1 amidase [Streptomyces sp. B-S-A6]